MKIPKYVRNKMHRLAKICDNANKISLELTRFFEDKGFDTEELWHGQNICLEQLEYGYDITDEFCKSIE